jgi:hypothetical protein
MNRDSINLKAWDIVIGINVAIVAIFPIFLVFMFFLGLPIQLNAISILYLPIPIFMALSGIIHVIVFNEMMLERKLGFQLYYWWVRLWGSVIVFFTLIIIKST